MPRKTKEAAPKCASKRKPSHPSNPFRAAIAQAKAGAAQVQEVHPLAAAVAAALDKAPQGHHAECQSLGYDLKMVALARNTRGARRTFSRPLPSEFLAPLP